jgi:hypothetical protein
LNTKIALIFLWSLLSLHIAYPMEKVQKIDIDKVNYSTLDSDIYPLIFNVIKDDEEDVLAFYPVSKLWKRIANQYYEEKNIELGHVPWPDHPELSALILYYLNRQYIFILAMYRNIIFDYLIDTGERTRFERAAKHIFDFPLIPESSLIRTFAKLLQMDLHCRKPTQNQQYFPISKIYEAKYETVSWQLSMIKNQYKIEYQNENVLYHYFEHIIHRRSSFYHHHSCPHKINCSMVKVLKHNYELANLRANGIDNLKSERIYQLDPGAGAEDYNNAGEYYHSKGNNEDAIRCFNAAIKSAQEGQQSPKLRCLWSLEMAYLSLKNYEKAAFYCDQLFEACASQNAEAQTIFRIQRNEISILNDAIEAHKFLGNSDKVAQYAKRVEEIQNYESIKTKIAAQNAQRAAEIRNEKLRRAKKAEEDALEHAKIMSLKDAEEHEKTPSTPQKKSTRRKIFKRKPNS